MAYIGYIRTMSEYIVEILCTPVAMVTVTLYVVVVGIDTTASKVFGEVWRERVGRL